MLNQLFDLLKIGGALLLFIAVWLVTIAIVFRDLNRRNLNGIEQFLWLAAVALLPLIGFLIYWVARFLTRLLLTEPLPGEDPRLRLTSVKPAPDLQGQRFSTIPGQGPLQQNPYTPPRPPAPIYYVLVATEGPYAGGAFPLAQFPAHIGRGTWASVALNTDQGISRQHAEIYPDSTGVLHIRDLNSTHGTFVNGIRVGDARLKPGDRITMGLSTFLFTQKA